ncbi:plant transposon protein [Nitzschia inconspicua]|uniref:Plant transposon protein n=1 Tax=Nitzschia inconspicua TaxID=303405 RepID=A0A9K3K466_9STRA|nr:plant transposon protein [Nitzschia inconspicua]KAG7361956.1 plant transposon protein [Nitzschia inconspicua]
MQLGQDETPLDVGQQRQVRPIDATDERLFSLWSMVDRDTMGNRYELLDDLVDDSNEIAHYHGHGQHGGSVSGRIVIKRDFEAAYKRLCEQYFNGDESLYTAQQFKRRYRVSPSIFEKVYQQLLGKGVFRRPDKLDACGRKGIHPLVRMTAAFRVLAYGCGADREDENLSIGESTVHDAVKSFCKLLIQEFGDEYLNRTPTVAERNRILKHNKTRGFPGLFASWDCKHFVWDNCPVALQGQHKGHHAGGKYTKILEAIADGSCYIWFVHFGAPGSCNDINVLDKSSIVGALLSGQLDLKTEPYEINGTIRDWMYFLVDGIYPNWAIFVKTIAKEAREATPHLDFYASRQEGVRKDIERAFGILVKKFHVLARPIRTWREDDMRNILYACIILHNMCCAERLEVTGQDVLETEYHDDYTDEEVNLTTADGGEQFIFNRVPVPTSDAANDMETLMTERFHRVNALYNHLGDPEKHLQLRTDLVAHLSGRQAEK